MSSKEEIYDYVMNNPQDTNGSVLGSLLNTLETGEVETPTIVGAIDFEENTITFPEEVTYKYLKDNLPQAKVAFYEEDYVEVYYYLSLFSREEYGEEEYYGYKFDSMDSPYPSFLLFLSMSDSDESIGTVELYLPEVEDNSLIILQAGTVIRDGERFSFFLDLPDGVTQQFIYENAERIAIFCSLASGGGAPYVNLTLMERWQDSSRHNYVTFHGKTNYLDGEKNIYLVFDEENTDEEIYVPQIVEAAAAAGLKTISFDEADMHLDEDGLITNEDVIAQLNTARVGDTFVLIGNRKTFMPTTFFEIGGKIACINICITDDLQILGMYTILEVEYGVWFFNFTGEE